MISENALEAANEAVSPEEYRGLPANRGFFDRSYKALSELFDKAKAAHELHFAMALMPEVRGAQDAGWSTAHEAVRAYDEFSALLNNLPEGSSTRIRVALAFYNHVAEGSGFYEIPKKLLLTIEGIGNNILPFSKLVEKHKRTGQQIAPNANKIMADLIGHATELGLSDLAEVIRDSFDPDVRNAVAHADYIIWRDGLRLRRRNGGNPRVIPWPEFAAIFERGINFFGFVRSLINEYVESYDPPKTIRARLNKNDPEMNFTIYCDPATHAFGITTGVYPPSKAQKQ